MKKFWIYMIGIAIFAFFYEWLKKAVGQPTVFIGGMVYILAVRLLAERFGK